MGKEKRFSIVERVKIYDTDAQGVVHYAGYYRFFTDTAEIFAEKFIGNYYSTDYPVWFVVVESKASYHKPSYIGDKLRVEILPKLISDKAIRFNFIISRGRVRICDGYIIQVCISKKTWKAVTIPNEIKKKMKDW